MSPPIEQPAHADHPRHELGELAGAFLRLGTTAFGGPAAHLAMMEAEFVARRAWLTRAELLDLIGAAALIPGPSSTQVAIYVGYRRAGWRGLVVAGLCFVLPAALLVTAIAWAYVRFGQLPAMAGALYALKPVVAAIVAHALLGFGKTAVKSALLLVLGAAAAVAHVFGLPPVLVLVACGCVSVAVATSRSSSAGASAWVWPAAFGAVAIAAPPSLVKLFLTFLKLGSVVFGSGYVLLAFLRTELVVQTHWLTEQQLIDAVAVGQFTPGPVFTMATFIGYLLAGYSGAVVATIGIFLPSFLLVAISGPLIPWLRQSRLAGAFLDGVNVAALALMAIVGVQLARAAIVDVPSAALAAFSALMLVRWRINSAWLVLGAGLVGAVIRAR